jgi:hypothetical protein
MGWTVESERPEVLLHYSEDQGIGVFDPHVPRSNPGAAPAVWAIDPARAPLYWFPRACPRVAVWANDAEQHARLAARFTTNAPRVHAVPLEWNEPMRTCALFEYRFDPTPFAPWPDAEGQWITGERVVPLAVVPVGDLIARHDAAGVDLRFVSDLTPWRELVVESDLPFSIVRWSRTI